MAKKNHKESKEQIALFQWAALYRVPYPPDPGKPFLSDYMFAIPNGGQRSKVEAAIMKAEGVKSGVSDIFIPIPAGGYCGFFIEMKPADGTGRATKEQITWAILMAACNYRAIIIDGWHAAKEAIIDYLHSTPPITEALCDDKP